MLATVVLMAQGMAQALDTGDLQAAARAEGAITHKYVADRLNQLQIHTEKQAIKQINQQLFGYLQTFGEDAAKPVQYC